MTRPQKNTADVLVYIAALANDAALAACHALDLVGDRHLVEKACRADYVVGCMIPAREQLVAALALIDGALVYHNRSRKP